MVRSFLASVIVLAGLTACAQKKTTAPTAAVNKTSNNMTDSSSKLAFATFGTGCFWCTEAIFQQLNGVVKVTSGYSGGKGENPTYKEVCGGNTGHAECLDIAYNPAIISFDELLEVFWQTHDPTTLNRQGADVGTQYRSVIFYHDDTQKKVAENYKAELDKSGAFNNPIVTTLEPFTKFYPAEAYHQNYYNDNKDSNPYCAVVIRPKLEKFEKVFKNKLKKQ